MQAYDVAKLIRSLLVSLALILVLIPMSAFAYVMPQMDGTPEGATADHLVKSGAASYQIKIAVPPGRQGIAPNLSLNYSSFAKNGWIGVGWGLDLGSIQRNPKGGLDYSEDRYLFNKGGSGQELVDRSTDWGSNFYGSKFESSFFKFEKSGNSWIVYSKEGTIYYYGSDEASRQFDPSNTSRIYKWCLDKVEDSNGNTMTISYTKDLNQIYPDEILYTFHPNSSAIHAVKFYLEDRYDDDAPERFNTLFSVTTKKRLKTVKVTANNQLVRAYELEYTRSASTDFSTLTKVTQYGADAIINSSGEIYSGKSLPSVVFDYQDSSVGVENSIWITRAHAVATRLPRNGYGDFNGDGKMDFMYIESGTGHCRVNKSTPTGWVDELWISSTAAAADSPFEGSFGDFNGDGLTDYCYRKSNSSNYNVLLSTGSSFIQQDWGARTYPLATNKPIRTWADFDGDGRTDYLYRRNNTADLYLLRSTESGFVNEFWGTRSYGVTTNPVRGVGDFDGDGKMDFMYRQTNSSNIRVMRSTDTGVVDEPWCTITRGIASAYEAVFGDFNGDGLTDYCYRQTNSQSFVVLKSTGSGFVEEWWGNRPVSAASTFPEAGVGDFDGDGIMDYAYRQTNTQNFYLLRSNGNSFDNVFWGTRPVGVAGSFAQNGYVDMDGDGKTDYSYRQSNTSNMHVMYSTGDIPDLMHNVQNGRGGETTYTYTPSSEYDNAVNTGARDEYLSFSMPLVSQVSVDDGINSPVATTYDYEGAYYDRADKEYRGFQKIAKTDPEGNISTTYNEVLDDWFKGNVLSTTVQTADSTLLSKTEFSYSATTEVDGWRFLWMDQKVSESYAGTTTYKQEDFVYNTSNGNLTSKTIQGTRGPIIKNSYEYLDYGSWVYRKTKETVEEWDSSASSWVKQGETRFDYEDDTGNLTDKWMWLDGVNDPHVKFQYDTLGNLTAAGDARGYTTTTVYDSVCNTYPVSVTNPKGHTVENEVIDYRYALATQVKGANGNRSYTTLDAFGRTVRTDSSDGGQSQTEYHLDVFPSYIKSSVLISSGNWSTAYSYMDGMGREIQTASRDISGYLITQSEYDSMGRKAASYGPFNSSTYTYPASRPSQCPGGTNVYDTQGRSSTSTVFGGGSVTYSYTGLDTTVTDADGKKKTEKRDYLGRVIEVVEDPDNYNYTTYFEYDAMGNATEITDHLGNVSSMVYDSLGRKTEMTDPNMGTWHYDYDANGNLIMSMDAKNQMTVLEYDALNRVITQTYINTNDPPVHYEYDNAAQGANGIGHLYRESNGVVTNTVTAYDSVGRVLSSFTEIQGQTYSPTTTAYDLAGNVTNVIYPDNYAVQYNYYPGTGLLHQVVGQLGVVHAQFSNYSVAGHAGRVDYANGTYSEFEFDPITLRMDSLETRDAGNTPIQSFDYWYSLGGNITTKADQMRQETYTYSYDNLHRLYSETSTGGQDNMGLTYDALGNILTKSVGINNLTYSYEMNGSVRTQRLASVAYGGNPAKTFVHDANGNMTQGWDFSDPLNPVQRTIQYNGDDKPISVTLGLDTTLFTYDANGDRAIKEVVGGDVTHYVTGGYEVVNGTPVKYIGGGGLSIAKITNGVTTYQHQDHLGSSSVATDSTGQCIEKSDYRPFGEERNHWGVVADKHRYTGQEKDFSTGLYNYNARLYDPILGRFISADIFVPDPMDPQCYNRFAYCRNNPLSYVDPSGNFLVELATAIVVGAILGGATEAIMGGDIVQGMIMGAISGAIFFGVGELGFSGLRQITAHALGGALSGGISSAITGGDIGLGMLTGAIGAGVAQGIGAAGWLPDDFCSQFIGRSVVGGLTSGVASTIYGQDFFSGFMNGAKTAAIGFMCNHMMHEGERYLGKYLGAEQGAAATEWYAEKYNETGNPIYAVGGCVAALWTPETYAETAMTLFGGEVVGVAGKALSKLPKLGKWAGKLHKATNKGGCFVAGTLVATSTGAVSIENIQAGDLVLARSQITGEVAYKEVNQTFVRHQVQVYELMFEVQDGKLELIQATTEHPFWVQARGWVGASSLVPGDKVFTSKDQWLTLKSNTPVPGLTTVYNFEVDEFHTYFVGGAGAWVHNEYGTPGRGSSGKKIVKWLKDKGYTLDRIEGSHHHMRGPNGNNIPVPVHANRSLKIGTIKNIVKLFKDAQ